MDTSPKYVAMCGAATEIKERHLWRAGDWFWSSHGAEVVCWVPACEFEFDRREKEQKVWLPRQDQLQVMIEGRLSDLIANFYEWNRSSGYLWYSDDGGTSLEQLWLRFVLEHSYGKQWIGTDWMPSEEPSP